MEKNDFGNIADGKTVELAMAEHTTFVMSIGAYFTQLQQYGLENGRVFPVEINAIHITHLSIRNDSISEYVLRVGTCTSCCW